MSKKKDTDLRQVMAEEGSRGRQHPVKAVTLDKETTNQESYRDAHKQRV